MEGIWTSVFRSSVYERSRSFLISAVASRRPISKHFKSWQWPDRNTLSGTPSAGERDEHKEAMIGWRQNY